MLFRSSGVDSSFSVKALLSRHNNELANDFGNLMMRVAKLSQKNFGNTLKNENFKQELQCDSLASDMNQAMEKREHHKALDLLWEKVNETNQYLNDKAPWKLKENPAQMKEVLFNGLYALTVISTNITPFLPSIGSQALQILGQTVPPKHFDTPFATLSFTFPEVIAPLFPKIEKTF